MLTQNAFADSNYAEYLRAVFARIWVPGEGDVQQAFQQYVRELNSRTPGPGEDVVVREDGRVNVQGVRGVMAINGIIAKMIFDHNKDKHEFYLENSYAIPWMYPYLEPHGLILKLNSEPLEKLPAEVVERDRQYWDALTKELMVDQRFKASVNTQKIFAKLRAAIAGVYMFRSMNKEAEYAFTQAINLCPTSPEALMGQAQLRLETGHLDEAKQLLDRVPKSALDNDWMRGAFDYLMKKWEQSKSK